jgi:GDPmannose 4,6-dehydratase
MWLMLQQEQAVDHVISTGRNCSLGYFVERAFQRFGLNWREHVVFNNELRRPSDITNSRGNPALAERQLGWKPIYYVDEAITAMCAEAERQI